MGVWRFSLNLSVAEVTLQIGKLLRRLECELVGYELVEIVLHTIRLITTNLGNREDTGGGFTH